MTRTMKPSAIADVESDGEVNNILFEAAEILKERLGDAGFADGASVALYAGSSLNRKQHLALGCSKIRARTVYRDNLDQHSNIENLFGTQASQTICLTCAENRTDEHRMLLGLALGKVTGHGRTFTDAHQAGSHGPNFARMRQELTRAKATFDMVLAAAETTEGELLVLHDGAEGSGVESVSVAPVSPLAWPLKHAADLITALECALLRAAGRKQLTIDNSLAERLAAASAAVQAGPYQIAPDRKGREVSALLSRKPRGEQDMPFASFVQDRFADWVAHCQENPGRPGSWRPDGAMTYDVGDLPWNLEVLADIDRWHIPPDPDLGPWEQMRANWQHLAVQQLSVLYLDWENHRSWVLEGGEEPALLLVRDLRQDPLVGLGALDRFDLLATALDRFPAEASGTPRMWVARVPLLVARALDGYSVNGGEIQAASLEGADSGKVEEIVSSVDALRETFDGNRWLSEAAKAAIACMA